METETTQYKLHEYRSGRHAFAGRRLFTATGAESVLDYARSLRGFSYVMVETTTLVMRDDAPHDGDEIRITYTESRYVLMHRQSLNDPFETSDWHPFDIDNYALVEVHMEGTSGPEITTTISTFAKLKDTTLAALTEYTFEGLQRDALLATFGSAHVIADREHIHQLPRVEEKADDLLNEMAHRLQGGEYYGH